MPRRLLLAALSLAAALAARPALACQVCAEPPAGVVVPDPPADAVFEGGAPGALLPGEKEWLSAVDRGRYEWVKGRLSDTRAQNSDEHLLTNAEVNLLLAVRTSERVAFLRERLKDGVLPPEFGGEAESLFWTRGALLDPEEQGQLRAMLFRRPPPKVGDPGFVEAGEAGAAGAAAGGAGAAAGTDSDAVLLGRLLDRVELRPGTDPRARTALLQAFDALVRTPTGREIAAEFVASSAAAVVQFGPVDGSTTVLQNGRRVLAASGGHAFINENPPRVVLNEHYLETDPDYRRVNLASTLGHELLGHSFTRHRAKSAGVSLHAQAAYRGDEADAGLTGWLVQTELGGRLDNGHMWNYLRDRELYHKTLESTMSYYSTTYSTAAMRDPIPQLNARLAALAPARRGVDELERNMIFWRGAIDHFVAVHRRRPGDFDSLRQGVQGSLAHVAYSRKNHDEIEARLRDEIKRLATPSADGFKAELRSLADSAFAAEHEARLARRLDRLREVTRGRSYEPAIPPVPGQITWEELIAMYEKDLQDNPGHWPAKGKK